MWIDIDFVFPFVEEAQRHWTDDYELVKTMGQGFVSKIFLPLIIEYLHVQLSFGFSILMSTRFVSRVCHHSGPVG